MHTCYAPVRHSPPDIAIRAAVRLACIRPAASVHSEPGSNSSLKVFEDESSNASKCRARPDPITRCTLYLRTNTLRIEVLFERLLWTTVHYQTPAQVTCAHCQRSAGPASAPFPSPRPPQRPSEPPIIQGFRRLSTPRDELFSSPPHRPKPPAGGPRIIPGVTSLSTPGTTALPAPPPTIIRQLRGRASWTTHHALGSLDLSS